MIMLRAKFCVQILLAEVIVRVTKSVNAAKCGGGFWLE